MTKVHEANQNYPFEQLSLANPHGIQGGAFFSKLLLNEEHPCLFQTPKCLTKNGIVRTGKKTYCDLIIAAHNDTFVNFLQELEKRIQHLIFEKRNLWFHNEMEMENIEYFFIPVLRTYKKQYVTRAYVRQPKHIKNIKSLQIYDENENILSLNDVSKENKIISIVEGLGIKFTSSSFHIDLCLRQIMVLEDKPLFEKCLIQTERSHFLTEQPLVPLITQNNDSKCISLSKKEELIASNADNEKLNLEKTDQVDEIEEDNPKEEATIITKIENAADKEDPIESNSLDNNERSEKETEEEVDVAPPRAPPSPITTNVELNIIEKEGDVATDSDDEEIKAPAPSPPPTNKKVGALEKKETLCEINLELPQDDDPIHLKKPIEVYREIYSHALEKARLARKQYVLAFLEAKKIKNTFLSSEIEDSDDDLDDFEEILE
jgi:hypothetical protein